MILSGPIRIAALRTTLAAATLLAASSASAASITLSGTIRDFCAPGIAGSCTQLSDFEGAITNVVTGMASATLNASGLPDAGPNIGAGASSAANFAKWFVDSPGYNLSQAFNLTLNETAPGSGTYTYSNSSFFPIDGQLYGNQTRNHNYHFTLHLEGQTSFKAGDSFTFTGDDDLWVYVGGKLVMDLGGVHGAVTTTISATDLVNAGLVADTVYDLDIFFAERHTTESNFNITTTLRLAPPSEIPEPGSIALLAAAIGAAGMLRRRRQRAE
jgi:fibro-slime domain-containing protein